MKVSVVNVRSFPFKAPLPYIYVGRRMMGKYALLTGHRLANPFRPSRNRRPTEPTFLEKYREWLFQLPDLEARLNCLAAEVAALKLPLGCWCAPLPCHTDILAEAIQPIVDRILKGTE